MQIEIENIIHNPEFPSILKELNNIWKREQQKREEFYNLITEQQKAEFIEGEIIFHSPVMNRHLNVSTRLTLLLSHLVTVKNLGMIYVEKCLISLTRNDFEPDICFFSTKKVENFTATQMKHPAPDFIVEILSESTEKYDRGVKFMDYEYHKIPEYWIIDPDKEILEQYLLTNNKYELNFKGKAGTVESTIIKGFKLFIPALFDENDWKIEYSKLMRTV
jgi:Uma2 family endonuclease